MKKALLLLIVFTLTLVSCAPLQRLESRPGVCDNISSGESVLCDMAQKSGIRPEDVGKGIVAVNAVLIARERYTYAQAVEVIDKLLMALDGPITYVIFKDKIQEFTKKYPGLLEVVREDLEYFALSNQIYPADKDILQNWLKRQRRYLGGGHG